MKQSLFDWSLLPHDVLSKIVLKLDTVEDFLNFSVVCHAWKSASYLIKFDWHSRFPWLLLAEYTVKFDWRSRQHWFLVAENTDCLRKLFSLNRYRTYELELPRTFGGRCFGSSCGWIVVFHPDLHISLVNPLTRYQVFLPPRFTMPNEIAAIHNKMGRWESLIKYERRLRRDFTGKAFVWKIKEDDLLTIAIHGKSKRALSFARYYDQVWTPIITPEKIPLADIVYWHGQMLIMYENGAIGCCDISKARSRQPLKALDYLPEPPVIPERFCRSINSLYMVDSFGDLLMVLRYRIAGNNVVDDMSGYYPSEDEEEEEYEEEEVDENFWYKTTTFKVFKLNFDTKEWEQVKDIGDVALFVGGCSMAVRASNSNNCKRNGIYFTDDAFDLWPDVRRANGDSGIGCGGHDMGLFDIETRRFRLFYEADDKYSDCCTPFWFIPNFSDV